ncbi:Uncharacterised protein [Vibrio cholerae]|nr:Uncharacterised protein [Vibrio cholerae]
MNRETESINVMAGSSPPVITKSPIDHSSSTSDSIMRSSTPS